MSVLRIHLEARAELAEAAIFYEGRVPGLGGDFLEEYRVVLEKILQVPEQPRCFFRQFRKLNLRRFPYAVVYRNRGDDLFVVAVMHLHRKPLYWKTRR